MTDKTIQDKATDKKDARGFAEFIKDARNRDSLFNSFIGVALSSYMNGVNDAAKSFKAAQAV